MTTNSLVSVGAVFSRGVSAVSPEKIVRFLHSRGCQREAKGWEKFFSDLPSEVPYTNSRLDSILGGDSQGKDINLMPMPQQPLGKMLEFLPEGVLQERNEVLCKIDRDEGPTLPYFFLTELIPSPQVFNLEHRNQSASLEGKKQAVLPFTETLFGYFFAICASSNGEIKGPLSGSVRVRTANRAVTQHHHLTVRPILVRRGSTLGEQLQLYVCSTHDTNKDPALGIVAYHAP